MKLDWRSFILCCLLVLAGQGRAQAEPSAAERETARAAMDEGDRQRDGGDLQSALVRYQAAHAIMHVPTTGIEVARTQVQLGLLVEARSSAIEAANLPVSDSEPAIFTTARRAAAQLSAQLEPRIPSFSTVVTPSDIDYSLSIDEVQLPAGARTIPFRTNPGRHVVVVKARGYTSAVEPITLTENDRRTLQIRLERVPAPKTPASSASIALSSALPTRDEGQSARVRGLIGLGVGGAVLAAAAVSGAVSAIQTSDLKQQCSNNACSSDLDDKRQTANTLANVANIGIPLGVIGVLYGVYELIGAARAARPPTAASHLHLQASPQGAYASWRGSL